MSAEYIGVDIGGHTIKVGRVVNGKVLGTSECPTEANLGEKAVLENIEKAINRVISDSIKGIGIGCPGPLDSEKGIIYHTVNLPFRRLDIVRHFSKKYHLPVRLDNDANAFALGEALYGAGKGHKYVVGVTLGTGFGGGIIIDGKIYHGNGNAGELGHTKIDYNGRKCHCSRKGCIEAYVSSDGIVETAKELGLEVGSPRELYQLALKGNKKALDAWNKTGEYLGLGLGSVIMALDPEVIIVGGKIAEAWEFFGEAARRYAAENSFSDSKVKIRPAKMEHAGIIGAASLFLK